MEREFELRRIETEKLPLTAGEHPSNVATSADESLSTDTGEIGQSVLQSEPNFGLDSGCAEADRISATAGEQPQGSERIVLSSTGATANQGGFTADTASGQDDGADAFTGWEAEREILFHPEMALAEDNGQPDVAAAIPNIGGVVGDVVRLGKAIERLGDTPPVSDAATKPQPHSGKKKKLAVGQKEDDHSGYDFTMTM